MSSPYGPGGDVSDLLEDTGTASDGVRPAGPGAVWDVPFTTGAGDGASHAGWDAMDGLGEAEQL